MKEQALVSRINKYLFAATQELCNWLNIYLPQISQDYWEECIVPNLSKDQFAHIYEKKVLKDFDLAILLRITNRLWDRIYIIAHLKENDKRIILEMIEIRNRWAHISGIISDLSLVLKDLYYLSLFFQIIINNKLYYDDVQNTIRSLEKNGFSDDDDEIDKELTKKPTINIRDSVALIDHPESQGIVLSIGETNGNKAYEVAIGGSIEVVFDNQIFLVSPYTKAAYTESYVSNQTSHSNIDFRVVAGVLKEYCGGAIDIVIPITVSKIDDNVFQGMMIKSVIIPKGVLHIGNNVFNGCSVLEKVIIPDTVETVGKSIFKDCKNLKEISYLGTAQNGLKSLYDGVKDCAIPVKCFDGYFNVSPSIDEITTGIVDLDNYDRQSNTFSFGVQATIEDQTIKPLKWELLTVLDGKALLFCRSSVACMEFISANRYLYDWSNSHIREWLNSDFAMKSFNSNDLEKINKTKYYEDYFFLANWYMIATYYNCLDSRKTAEEYWIGAPYEKKSYSSYANWTRHVADYISTSGTRNDCDTSEDKNIRPVCLINLRKCSVQLHYEKKALSIIREKHAVFMGRYDQSFAWNDLKTYPAPYPEPYPEQYISQLIKWDIVDIKDEYAMLVSHYALDYRCYDEEGKDDWRSCSIRSWLNGEFINTTFDQTERKHIVLSVVHSGLSYPASENKEEPSNASRDLIFLLSEEEFRLLREKRCADTDFARKKKYSFDDEYYSVDQRASCEWWLRNAGKAVSKSGSLYRKVKTPRGRVMELSDNWSSKEKKSIRPAMWIKLD